MAGKRYAKIGDYCVACGCCVKVCPTGAVRIWKGVTAVVETDMCIGCGKCSKECPAGAIELVSREVQA